MTRPPKRTLKFPSALFGLAVMLGGVALAVVLVRDCGGGRDALEAYARAVRAGEDVDASVAGEEAPALTEALRGSTGVGVDNFQAQAGTACYWVQIMAASGRRSARFVLREQGDDWVVSRASLARECECPDPDFEQACHLR